MLMQRSRNAVLLVSLFVSVAAQATNGILQVGNGMVAHGLGGAGLANAAEASAGMDNPALIALTGDAVAAGLSYFSPNRSYDVGGGYIDSESNRFYIPHAAYSTAIRRDLSWGVMAYAMGGMNTDYPANPAGLPYDSGVNLSGLIVAPSLAWRWTPKMSVGASLLLGYENLKMRNVFGITGDDTTTGYGVKLGFVGEVTNGIDLGFTIQPRMVMREVDYFCGALRGGFGFQGDCQVALPDIFGIGGKFTLGKNMTMVADVMQVQWSGMDVFDFFGWQDQTVYKLGMEWRQSPRLALRAGYNYGKSPIPQNRPGVVTMNTWFPAITEHHVTLGASYRMDDRTTLTAYGLHAFENDATDSAGVGTPLAALGGFPASRSKMNQNALGIGFNITLR